MLFQNDMSKSIAIELLKDGTSALMLAVASESIPKRESSA